MNCSRITNLLSAYIDGELTGQEMLEIRHHLASCNECQDEYESLRSTKQMMSHLRRMSPRDGFATDIITRLDDIKVPAYQRFFTRLAGAAKRNLAPVGAAAAVCALAFSFLTTGFFSEGNESIDAQAEAMAYMDNSRMGRMHNASFTSDINSVEKAINARMDSNTPLPVIDPAEHDPTQKFVLVSVNY